ncbi:MAG: FtsX-like permease family protein, partial [Saprospiraceae bacterium]|nr:FtsX-like permease family protein [Saprospiraceae bacterium]
DKEIGFNVSPNLLLSFLGITLFTGLLAGSYPALYLSSFNPVTVLKGELKSSWGEIWARRGLVIFQFALSIILIVAVLVVFKQIEFVQSQNLGYDKDHLVHFPIDGTLEDQSDVFIQQAKQLPGVVNASSIAHDLVGRQNNTSGLQWEGKNPEDRILFEHVRVGYDLLETLGVEVLTGRSFSRSYGQDTNKIIFNEEAVKIMGMTDPIGKQIRLWDQMDMEIIGVVKNFHFQSLHETVKPLFFRLAPDDTWMIIAKLGAGREKEALGHLQTLYERFNPGFPFEHRFVDEEYDRLYAAEQKVSELSRYFAGLAILISCLGLFGLATFTGERRKKEIGVRKVLGASVGNIVFLLTRDFTRLVIIAILIGLPIAFYLTYRWLDRFEFKIGLQWSYFAFAGVILLLISWLTVSSQAFRAATVHPGDCMKEE